MQHSPTFDSFGHDIDRALVIRASEYPSGYQTGCHWHARFQLVYASAGVMKVFTNQGIWVVPSQRAVWIPANVTHEVQAVGQLTMRSLYIDPDYATCLPANCAVVNVTPLLRELILRASSLPTLYELGGQEERIMDLILDEIQGLPISPLHLPEPEDSRISEITRAIIDEPADKRTLETWSCVVGASSRTLARLFSAETNMTFRNWQRQARLLAGLVRLAEGQPVTTVALDVGYDSPSAFIAMFKRALGMTPGQYFSTVQSTLEDNGTQ